MRYLLPPDQQLLDRLAREPGVLTVAPRLMFSGMASHGESTISFIGEAVDPVREEPFENAITITEGTALPPGDTSGVMLGKGLATNLDVKAGDRIVLLVNKSGGSIRAVEVTVRGCFSTALKAYDDVALRVPLVVAKNLLGVTGTHIWAVLLTRTENTDEAAKRIGKLLPAAGFEIVPWYQLSDFYNKSAALFAKQVLVEKLIIAVIIILSISNIMTMSVIERTREIGTMMALGTAGRKILTMYLVEGALLGMIGGVIGLMLGGLLAVLISKIGIPMPAPPGMPSGYRAEILVTYQAAIEALCLAVATTVLASLHPAWLASRQVIVDALRHGR